MPRKPEAARRAVTEVLRALLARWVKPGRYLVDYGVSVRSVTADPAVIKIAFRFLADREYCCDQLSCHFGKPTPAWWRRFREAVTRAGLELPVRPLSLYFAVFVEPGARSACFGRGDSIETWEETWREDEARTQAQRIEDRRRARLRRRFRLPPFPSG